MDFELKTLSRARTSLEKCDAMIVLLAQNDPHFSAGDDAALQLADTALKSGDFEAKPGKLLNCYRAPGLASTRLLLVGVGDGSLKNLRSGVTAAMVALKGGNIKRAVLNLSALHGVGQAHVRAVMVACADALYSYNTTKSKAVPLVMEKIIIAVPEAPVVKPGFEAAAGLVKGMDLAKEWANRPANYATPSLLATAAKSLGKLPGVKVEVLGPKEVDKLGMGAFMAVSRGSDEPLRFIVMHYMGAPKSDAPVVLVGKGITFDTGGISIKQAADMDEMKFDMCGAASVLGTFKALAELKPAINVVGLIPACENMPDGRAIKPGDVVTSMSGQTIEILNTDAEGRLVLCDALTYAERFKPRAVVDIATLTGACVVALGGVRTGLFSNNEALAQALMDAGESSLDLCWRLPLDDDYAEGLKTNFADVANVAGRAGGAVTAAKFLQRFAGKFAWAHLDIAGTAWKSGAAKGATGRPVALLLDYLLGQVQTGQQVLAATGVSVKTPPKTNPKSVSKNAPPKARKTVSKPLALTS